MPVVGRELPAFERIVLARAQAPKLLARADVQEELDEHGSLGGHHVLEGDDLVVGAVPLLALGEAVDALDQHAAVPGAIEDGHPAPAGERRHEAPQEVVAALALVGGRELDDAHVAGVERGDQAADRAALAGGVPALEQHGDRRAEAALAAQAAHLQAQREQPPLKLRELLELLLGAQALGKVHVVEPDPPRDRRRWARRAHAKGRRQAIVRTSRRLCYKLSLAGYDLFVRVAARASLGSALVQRAPELDAAQALRRPNVRDSHAGERAFAAGP